MTDYKKIRTSKEVWMYICAEHKDLVVFSSYSAPESGCMETSFGFRGAECPLIHAKTTWDVGEFGDERKNELHEYWLCYPIKERE